MRRRVLLVAACLLGVACADRGTHQTAPDYGIGSLTTEAALAGYNIDVNAEGAGLPAGNGTAVQGAAIYAQKCAVCHGANGEGQGTFPKLIGAEPRTGFPFGRDPKLPRTIGNYWPYATTVFDYVRRAMPMTAPGSLQPAEVYSLTAFLLARNQIIGENDVVDAQSLPRIRMPAHDHFVRDDRTGGANFR